MTAPPDTNLIVVGTGEVVVTVVADPTVPVAVPDSPAPPVVVPVPPAADLGPLTGRVDALEATDTVHGQRITALEVGGGGSVPTPRRRCG